METQNQHHIIKNHGVTPVVLAEQTLMNVINHGEGIGLRKRRANTLTNGAEIGRGSGSL